MNRTELLQFVISLLVGILTGSLIRHWIRNDNNSKINIREW